MQSWGTSSRFQLRRTDLIPSKSGVIGMLLCARGISREESTPYIEELAEVSMGVRVDLPGTVGADYHTAGAKIGIRQPKDGKPKLTDKTKLPEVQLSRRQYLFGASFLVALQAPGDWLSSWVEALQNPAWPVYLGRKCCVPSLPVYAGTGEFATVADALESKPLEVPAGSPEFAGARDDDYVDRECWLEHTDASPPPPEARQVYDVPRKFGYWNYLSRWIAPTSVTVPVQWFGRRARPQRANPYGPEWDAQRTARLETDRHLCVFCKSPATQVHHLDYEDVRNETLRSLCEICHDACTMLEYSQGDEPRRVDPADPACREELLEQIHRILTGRRCERQRQLLQGD